MMLYKYELLKYEDPEKEDSKTNNSLQEPKGPGKIAQALQMMANGEF